MATEAATVQSFAERSRRAFILTMLLLLGGGAVFAIGLGAAFSKRGPDVLAPVGILMLVAAACQNLIAFHAGVLAWRKERVRCRWLYVNGLLIAGMIAFGIMLLGL